jgi:hypothetical protein
MTKKRGAEAPQSETTEALFHVNRIQRWGKSCPGKQNICTQGTRCQVTEVPTHDAYYEIHE